MIRIVGLDPKNIKDIKRNTLYSSNETIYSFTYSGKQYSIILPSLPSEHNIRFEGLQPIGANLAFLKEFFLRRHNSAK